MKKKHYAGGGVTNEMRAAHGKNIAKLKNQFGGGGHPSTDVEKGSHMKKGGAVCAKCGGKISHGGHVCSYSHGGGVRRGLGSSKLSSKYEGQF